jgi:hypothetical protein
MTLEEILKDKQEAINIKKSAYKHSDVVDNHIIKDGDVNVTKVILEDEEQNNVIKVIANTYYWLDSHGDVHVKGTFTKSIKENVSKIFHFDNHEHSFNSKVGNVKSVKEVNVNWSDLGVQKEGKTICVIGETELVEDYNCQVYGAYKNNEINQHSVGMQYVNIQIAVNQPQEVEAYKLWNEVYPLLGNPETADKLGYFWVVKEAKLKEYSCVLWNGSNSLTPTLKNIEAVEDTSNNEPLKDTQDEQKQFFINLLKQTK